MTINKKNLYGLIGALKSQYLYQSSLAKKASEQGKEYQTMWKKVEPKEALYYLVKELEEKIETAEKTKKFDSEILNIKIDIEYSPKIETVYEDKESTLIIPTGL